MLYGIADWSTPEGAIFPVTELVCDAGLMCSRHARGQPDRVVAPLFAHSAQLSEPV
eukprot:gene50500-25597_t